MSRLLAIAVLAVVLSGLASGPAAGQENVSLFVTSMATQTVNVFRGRVPSLELVKSIPTGREPHNLGISPDGRWVALSNRRSGEVSIIDAQRLVEVARVAVGRQPHDLAFTSDSQTLYVCHEQEQYVSVIEVGTWKLKPRLEVGRSQHDISISPDNRELWFTVTNRPYKPGDPRVGVMDLQSGKRVALLDTGANAHDVTLSPDGKQAWVTNSGFVHLPDARVDYLDVATRKVQGSIALGKYPFHSPKRGRDGNYVPPNAGEMWFSDHGEQAVLAVSLKSLQVTASVRVGAEPYHVTATPGGILFVASRRSSTVTIIDAARRAVLGTINVPREPHGLAVL
jgi:YVTN family beta-propeller protein